jgi:hypothetical protein
MLLEVAIDDFIVLVFDILRSSQAAAPTKLAARRSHRAGGGNIANENHGFGFSIIADVRLKESEGRCYTRGRHVGGKMFLWTSPLPKEVKLVKTSTQLVCVEQ